MPAKSLCSAEASIFRNSRLTSPIMRDSSDWLASARTVSPLRICARPKSMLPIIHASENMVTSDGLNDGVRALPERKRSRLRVSSEDSRDVSTPKRSDSREVGRGVVQQLQEI